jgi:dihydrofolate reductase
VAYKRKIIVYIATGADGFIARPDGSVDWLDPPRSKGDYGMAAFYRSIDTYILARKTYDSRSALACRRPMPEEETMFYRGR